MCTAEAYLLQKAKDDFDWLDYLDNHYELMHTSSDTEFRVCCPSCTDRKFKCYVNTEKKVFNCFKCEFQTGRKYDVVNFIALTEKITYVQALLKLTNEYSPKAFSTENMNSWVQSIQEKAQVESCTQVVSFPGNTRNIRSNSADLVWKYAVKRGLTQDILDEVGALGVYDNPKLGTRLLLPVYAGDAVLASWQARDVTGKSKVKYLSAPGTKLSDLLWPNVSSVSKVILVEGIIDAISIRNSTTYSAFATFGKHISVAQCQKLVRLGVREAILWYDKRDAHKDMVTAVARLRDYVDKVSVVSLTDWDKNIDVGDLLSVPTDLAKSAIEKQLMDTIDCASLEYTKWSLCP